MRPIKSALFNSAGSFGVKIAIVLVAALGGVGLVASNVFAALTATATNSSGGSVTTGTLKLEYLAAGGSLAFGTPISAIGPGDRVNRYIDLTVSGNLDGESPTVQITTSDSNTIVNDAVKGLQISISSCSQAWTQVGVGSCGGTTTSVLASTSVVGLKNSAINITLPAVLASGVNRLRLSILLPAANENTVNGVLPGGTVQWLTAALTWSFVIQERAVTNTSS